jgi:hypothetical protein
LFNSTPNAQLVAAATATATEAFAYRKPSIELTADDMSPPSTPSPLKPTSTTSSPAGSTSTASTTPCSDPYKPSAHELARALVVAANLYKEQDGDARSINVHFDESVQVELPQHRGTFLIDIELLGRACEIAKGRVGKLRVDAFQAPGEEFCKVFVRQVASGYTHGEAVLEVGAAVANAVLPFCRHAPQYARAGTDGMYGSAHISAPDVTVRSIGTDQGEPAKDSEFAPLFFLEVEDGNRSLLCLIRHLGMLLVNFPHLNGVLGIKGEEKNGIRILVLILIEWRTDAGTGVRQPCVTELVDFGPDSLSDIRRNHAETALQLPLPPVGEEARAREHGAGVVAEPFPVWTRLVSGRDAAQQPASIILPATLLLAGAHDVHGTIITIPGNALGAELYLDVICSIYFP